MNDILDYLIGIVDSIVAYMQAIFTFLGEVIEYIAVVLYDILLGIVEFLYGLIKILASGLKHIIQDLLSGNFSQLWQDVINLRQALAAYIEPVMQAIRAEQLYLQHLFNLYLGPILSFIQSLRRVLELLKAAGVKWAGTLDSYLGIVEDSILDWFNKVITAINRHADIFEYLLDPLGFLQIIPLLHIVALRAEDLTRLFTGHTWNTFSAGTDSGLPPATLEVSSTSYLQQLSTNTSSNTGNAKEWNDQLTYWLGQRNIDPGA